jgi:hypothetical protein
LIERVRARSPRVRFVDDGSGLAIRAQISTISPGVVAGDVSLASAGAKPSVRHVRAGSCTEAADAVALIIAVTLDPTADSGARTEVRGEPAARTGESGSSNANPALGAPARRPQKNALIAATSESSEVAATRGSPHTRLGFGLGFAAESFLGVAPGVMPSVALFAMLGLERPSLWSPAGVLGVRHAWRTNVEEDGGNASFSLDAATLDACPLRFRRGVFEARPCASLLFGRLSARGTDTTNPAPESRRPFWVLGGAGLFTWELSSSIEVTGRIGIGANLVRDSFAFSPSTFYTVPPVSAAASVGIGVRSR